MPLQRQVPDTKFACFLGSAIAARLSYCVRSSSETFRALAGFPKTSSDLKGSSSKLYIQKERSGNADSLCQLTRGQVRLIPQFAKSLAQRSFVHVSATEACSSVARREQSGKPLPRDKAERKSTESRRDRSNRFPSPKWGLVP